jgi:hypothetical protein
MVVSVLSVNLVTVLFINLAAVLKRCFTRINTCLYQLIQCVDEKSVGIYGQIPDVKNSESVIELSYKCDTSKSKLVHIRQGCEFVCDFVDHFNSVYSLHALVLLAFYAVIFIYDTYYGVVQIMNVNMGRFGSGMWIMVTCTETVCNAAGFTVLIYFCSGATFQVRRHIYAFLMNVDRSKQDGRVIEYIG